jgi:hypothetical protein
MGLSIDQFAQLAGSSEESVRISGRCAVFAETDVIEKQQRGIAKGPIARGLCEALVRNFLSSVAGGKDLAPPIVFQGGVASNDAVRTAFKAQLGQDIRVPQYHDVMGAVGIALIAKTTGRDGHGTRFKGFEVAGGHLVTKGFDCSDCPNVCEILEIFDGDTLISRWGSRCGKWDLEQ